MKISREVDPVSPRDHGDTIASKIELSPYDDQITSNTQEIVNAYFLTQGGDIKKIASVLRVLTDQLALPLTSENVHTFDSRKILELLRVRSHILSIVNNLESLSQ